MEIKIQLNCYFCNGNELQYAGEQGEQVSMYICDECKRKTLVGVAFAAGQEVEVWN